jgi:hypothetical protein
VSECKLSALKCRLSAQAIKNKCAKPTKQPSLASVQTLTTRAARLLHRQEEVQESQLDWKGQEEGGLCRAVHDADDGCQQAAGLAEGLS